MRGGKVRSKKKCGILACLCVGPLRGDAAPKLSSTTRRWEARSIAQRISALRRDIAPNGELTSLSLHACKSQSRKFMLKKHKSNV
jgi:hypothetical protein